jgi:glucose-6-phosphate 1-dehydrogenase
VQNIMALRFANGLFEPIWNRDRIDHVQITVAESIGVETRGKFYEATGALRDMVPNHLFQLVAMTAMEPPVSFDAEDIRAKKAEMFKAIHPLSLAMWCAASMTPASSGEQVLAYRAESQCRAGFHVETYAAMRLMIDNWRWAGVPFYLRTGKRLNSAPPRSPSASSRRPCPVPRDAGGGAGCRLADPARAAGRRHPPAFQCQAARPAMALESVAMDFKYKDYFSRRPRSAMRR